LSAPGPLQHIREHPEIEGGDVDLIERTCGRQARVLDIGAGRGGFVRLACDRGLRAMALDAEPTAPAYWRSSGTGGVLADAFHLPFRDGSFDVVRMKELLEHVSDPRRLLHAAAALLGPNGLVIAHVPSPYSQLYPQGNFWDDYTHVRPLSRFGLRRLSEDCGLHVLSIEGYTAGRNAIERMVGKALARVLPHTYRLVARTRSAP
jgi:SAM-dependent methyltransferase